MKTYVLFTFAIYGIGGTQIYARNKMLYLREKGWNTCMVTTEPGSKIMVKEMEEYQDGVFPQLMTNPYLYTARKRKSIIRRVITYIRRFAPEGSEIVIESNFMAITLWAELVAQTLKTRNFILLIQENYALKSRSMLDFFSFKYNRGELCANTPQALSILFEDYRTISNPEKHFLSAYCSNVLEESDSILPSPMNKTDFNIGSIGRINKPFVLPMVKEIVKYVNSHKDKTFNLVLFGGSPEQNDYDRIYNEAKGIDNLYIYITGPLFPVPLSDVRAMDVFISSAGAARTSANAGKLTVALDAMDYQPIGVVGINTESVIHRDKSRPVVPLTVILNDLLLNHKYDGVLKENIEDWRPYYDKSIELLEKSEKTLQYYDVKRMAPRLGHRIIFQLFGAKTFKYITRIVNDNIRHKKP